ncbi:MAG: class II aldolase/adducin family protein [Saprospirales bacterium]|nr:class II aldolase/adducin family protein [Saprospirales bacterium]
MEEGYIKFKVDWDKGEPVAEAFLEELIQVRKQVYQAGWIGVYPDGVGYGNISKRWDSKGRFVISGTATGHLEDLSPAHFSLVTEAVSAENSIHCVGPVLASSESMSHAAIYRHCPEVQGVIHIHDLALWKKWINRAPTTPESVTYGSPEMADAISRLLDDPAQRDWQFFVMAGHREGCMAYGKDLGKALEVLRHFHYSE